MHLCYHVSHLFSCLVCTVLIKKNEAKKYAALLLCRSLIKLAEGNAMGNVAQARRLFIQIIITCNMYVFMYMSAHKDK